MIRKLRYYRFFELFPLVCYRVGYLAALRVERFLWRRKVCSGKKIVLKDTFFVEKIFWKLPEEHIAEAESILDGFVNLFGVKYSCLDDYLRDPISLSVWPKDEFFFDAKTKRKGYGDVKYVLELNKLNHLVTVAIAYFHTREDRYIYCIGEHLDRWCKQVPYESSVANKIMMDLAFRSINLIYISILCSSSAYFRNKIYPLIHNVLFLCERQMRKFSTPRWFKTGNGANHVVGEMVGLIILQRWLGMVGGQSVGKRKIRVEYKWLYGVLNKLIAPSGVYLEHSANYTRLVAEFLVALDLFEEFFGVSNAFLKKKYLAPLLHYLECLSYHGELPNFGDNDAAVVLIPLKKYCSDIEPLLYYNRRIKGGLGENPESFIEAGHFIWDSKDLFDIHVFARVGNWSVFRPGAASHQHCDLLALLLYAEGFPVFVDKGTCYYNQSEMERLQCVQTSSHNTIVFLGEEQADYYQGGWYNYPESGCVEKREDSCIFCGYVRYKNVAHERGLYYMNGCMIIVDSVEKELENVTSEIRYLLHEAIRPVVQSSTVIDLVLPSGKKICVECDGATLRVEDDVYYPHYAAQCATTSICGRMLGNVVTTKIRFGK